MTPSQRGFTARNAASEIVHGLLGIADDLPPEAVRLAERLAGVLAARGHQSRNHGTPASAIMGAAELMEILDLDRDACISREDEQPR